MIRVGSAPYLECSSIGDRRFSAFFAKPKILTGRSIEEAYQNMKIFSDGSTHQGKAAKGRRDCINLEECQVAYRRWWRMWIEEQNLLSVLKLAPGLQDTFGQSGHICQAEVLWDIRNENQT